MVGEGWAELGSDPGQAREQAKARALGDLALNARVTVQAALADVLGQSNGTTIQTLQSQVNAYAQLAPVRLDKEEFVLHSPRRGTVTCRVGVRRAQYDEQVRRDLQQQKDALLGLARTARTEFNQGRIGKSFQILGDLLARRSDVFADLSIDLDTVEKGRTHTVWDWARSLQSDIGRSLKLRCGSDPLYFDSRGKYSGPVRVQVTWSKTQKVNLSGMPLEGRWAHRPNAPGERAQTDASGTAAFTPAVDLFNKASEFVVSLAGQEAPACRQLFQRKKTALLTVAGSPEKIRRAAETDALNRLQKWPWDLRLKTDETDTADVIVILHLTTSVTKNPDGPVYRARAGARLEVQSMGKMAPPVAGPTADGFGATAQQALHDAGNKLLSEWGDWLDQKMELSI